MKKIFALAMIVFAFGSTASAIMAKPHKAKQTRLFCYENMNPDLVLQVDLDQNGKLKIERDGSLMIEEFNQDHGGAAVDPETGVNPDQKALILAGISESGQILFKAGKSSTAIVYAFDSSVLTQTSGQIKTGTLTYNCNQ